jgi:hypothetical protein
VNLRLIEACAEDPKEVLKEAMRELAVYQASREVEREQKDREDEGEFGDAFKKILRQGGI